MSLVKIGVIGCADIAERYVIPSILNLSEIFTLCGIASRTKAKASKFATKFQTIPFSGYESLLEKGDLDAVYIPLPNSEHAEWIEQALSRGINVLVEKSMACNFEDVKRLNEKAAENGLVLMENFQFRFHQQLSTIKNIVNRGKIGRLRCIRSSFGFPAFKDKNNIRYKQELGGGALLDAGVYPIKIAQIFLGHDINVTSASLCYEGKEVDIWGGAYLNQNDGPLFAEIAFGFDHFYQCNLEIWGSKGKVNTNRIFTAPPGYSPRIIFESKKGIETISVEPCNHFEKMLTHFHMLIVNQKDIENEYKQNINQARIIQQLKLLA